MLSPHPLFQFFFFLVLLCFFFSLFVFPYTCLLCLPAAVPFPGRCHCNLSFPSRLCNGVDGGNVADSPATRSSSLQEKVRRRRTHAAQRARPRPEGRRREGEGERKKESFEGPSKGEKNPSVERARRGVLRDLELWEQMKNEGIYLTRGKRGGKIGLDGRRVDGGKKGKRYG